MKRRIKIFTDNSSSGSATKVEEEVNQWLEALPENNFGVDLFLSTDGTRVTVMASYRDE